MGALRQSFLHERSHSSSLADTIELRVVFIYTQQERSEGIHLGSRMCSHLRTKNFLVCCHFMSSDYGADDEDASRFLVTVTPDINWIVVQPISFRRVSNGV